MKISTKGRYALRLMLDLAMNEREGAVIRIKDIAARQQISDKYLEQIISVLNRAGYVRSVRGPQGGYALKRRPEEYTVGMILRLTEGSLAPVPCAEEEFSCERGEQCAAQEVWRKINDAVNGVLDDITLADLVGIQREKDSGGTGDHHAV